MNSFFPRGHQHHALFVAEQTPPDFFGRKNAKRAANKRSKRKKEKKGVKEMAEKDETGKGS